jgi:hypothetical protein
MQEAHTCKKHTNAGSTHMQEANTCRKHTHAGSTHMQGGTDTTQFEVKQGKAEHARTYVSVLEPSHHRDAVTDVLRRKFRQLM